ncbi:hypothetical protein Ocin01_03789 [Orchesella cincta]|uniref:Uncharacterized protein n=1 Tax=Orchesella cincta TaxID=48709 RepID=A0A1D2NCC4_ORCCI|nr:hypothetical protein Ocin01_03789 [Orchesella cincta]
MHPSEEILWAIHTFMVTVIITEALEVQQEVSMSARSHLSVQRTKSAPLPNFLAQGLSTSPPMSQFEHLNPLGSNPADFLGGLNFSDAAALGLNADMLSEGGLGGDHSGLNQGSGATMSALDITSRLESLCLSMTEAALGLSCTNY